MQVFTNIQPDTIRIFSRKRFRNPRNIIRAESIFEQVLLHMHRVELTPNFQKTKCSHCESDAISFCEKCYGFHCLDHLDSDCRFVTEELF